MHVPAVGLKWPRAIRFPLYMIFITLRLYTSAFFMCAVIFSNIFAPWCLYAPAPATEQKSRSSNLALVLAAPPQILAAPKAAIAALAEALARGGAGQLMIRLVHY